MQPSSYKLMKMFAMTEAARAARAEWPSTIWKIRTLHPSRMLWRPNVFPRKTATYVASEAMQIFGGYGLAKEYPWKKCTAMRGPA
ncbi:MAG: hypothetical protein MZU91_14230 [Desulfosudis oleivorans]|nr:hypothetical protein [Desulfosudis oleivorans]